MKRKENINEDVNAMIIKMAKTAQKEKNKPKTKRKGISQKVRFEVFKRDGFSCQYCGKTANVTLEIDHIMPISKGGTNDFENLITACYECNRGKGAKEIGVMPETLEANYAKLKEKEKQYKKYLKLMQEREVRMQTQISIINCIYRDRFNQQYVLKDSFQNSSVRMFIEKAGIDNVIRCMHIACSRGLDKESTINYFCGCCWKVIRGEEI